VQADSRSIFRVDRAVGLLAAVAILLQIVAVGFATGAMAGDGVVCVTPAASATSSDSTPLDKHLSPCCVIHCSSAAAEVEGVDAVAVVLSFDFPTAARPRFDARTTVAAADPPELRPLSPRAPPALRA
jgi:hypothetical protein